MAPSGASRRKQPPSSASSLAIGPAKIALKLIKNLTVPLAAAGLYANEILEFTNEVSRIIGVHISNGSYNALISYIDDNGILNLLNFISQETSVASMQRMIIDQNGMPTYLVSTSGVSSVIKGVSQIGKAKNGFRVLGRVLKKFDKSEFEVLFAKQIAQISEQSPAVARKILGVIGNQAFPDDIVRMLKNADPQQVADFLENAAAVFAQTGLREKDMLKILQAKWIYSPDALVTAANVMSLGKMMENMSIVAGRHKKNALPVIKGLTKYASGIADTDGYIHSGYDWFGAILHGRRAEIDRLAEVAGSKPGADVVFETVKDGGKIVGDIDGSLGTTAWSIKRQGATLDRWVSGKKDPWLKAYLIKVKTGGGKLQPSQKLEFWTGGNPPSAATIERLTKLSEGLDIEIDFEPFNLLPPPAIN
jgi:hypothetical protein